MGSGASSLIRLRKALVMRAYNLREPNQTFEEQFKIISYRSDGITYILLSEISKMLSFNAPWLEELFSNLIDEGTQGKRMKFLDFIEFLETGKTAPLEVMADDKVVQTIQRPLGQNGSVSDLLKHDTIRRSVDSAGSVGTTVASSESFPPFPPSAETSKPVSAGIADELLDDEGDMPGVLVEEPLDESYSELIPVKSREIVVSKRRPVDTDGKSLWKKKEILRQERTIQYTTVDPAGTVQELVEKEVSETEVVHMECRETGEFVHRELTVYEQKETFNNEIVNEQFGTKEYLHMKSTEDEMEYHDSTMPNNNAPAHSPPRRAADDEEHSYRGEHNEDEHVGAGCTPPRRSSAPLTPDGSEGRAPGSEDAREGKSDNSDCSSPEWQPYKNMNDYGDSDLDIEIPTINEKSPAPLVMEAEGMQAGDAPKPRRQKSSSGIKFADEDEGDTMRRRQANESPFMSTEHDLFSGQPGVIRKPTVPQELSPCIVRSTCVSDERDRYSDSGAVTPIDDMHDID